eukprot:1142672-Pelagomonas_calceolata.AAC.4
MQGVTAILEFGGIQCMCCGVLKRVKWCARRLKFCRKGMESKEHELKKSQTASADTAFKGNLAEAKKCLEPNQMLERMSTHGR